MIYTLPSPRSYSTALLSLFFILTVSLSYAQLSPGDLAQSHAEHEGLSNCTLCHSLGDKVTNQKCLDCHDDMQGLINAGRGYHAAPSVRRQDCIECHSDHHGRRFDMVRFDEDQFDHDLTGYELLGQHNVIDCRDCHQPDNIANTEFRSRTDTYLGLEQECLSCHDDYHQQTLSNDCIACHNIEAFRPAPGFDHDETDYPLQGQHTAVDCKECHAISLRNGQEYQAFSEIPFQDCVACHDDPHEGQIKGTCTQCHTVNSFTTFLGRGRFNHNTTGFSLRGKHRQEDCFSCHAQSSGPFTVFQDQHSIEENNCAACHEDVHEGKYGNNCVQCHSETSFLALKEMDFFDHTVTDYPLEGQHQEVDCRECHVERFSTPIDFSACKNCHEDYHQGEFAANTSAPDCIDCHSLAHGFDYSLYTLEQHQTTSFPLEGAHLATPCFACHISEEDERWTFRNIGSTCVDCHEDIHEGYISASYYPENDCAVCHANDAWASVNFDHNQTDWPLEGKHLAVDCRDCHFEMADNGVDFTQAFTNLETNCLSCHENVHGDEFAVDGVTDCVRCHITDSWMPEKFDHSTTDFPLDGKHAEVECRACHEITQEDGSIIVVYPLEKFACIDCHQ